MVSFKKYIWILLTALAFGTMEIALKIGGNAFSALQLTFLRFLIGGLFLLPFALHDLKKRGHKLSLRDWGFIFQLAFINIVISMTLFQMSVMHANANLAAVLISFNPMFTMIFAHFIAHEHFTLHKFSMLAICLSGLLLAAAPWHLAQGNTPIGIVMGLGAALAFGLYTALSKKRIAQIGTMPLTSFSFIIGAMMELVLLLIHKEPVFQNVTSPDALPVLIYVSLIVTGFGYFCFMRAVERAGATYASYAFFLKPVIAMCLAAIVLNESITWNIALGVAIIVAGCILNTYQPKLNTKVHA